MHAKTLTTLAIVGLLIPAAVSHGRTDNTVTFDNQSGEPALVRLVGPTRHEVEVAVGQKRTVAASSGQYHIKTRYGTPGRYRYTKGDEFAITDSSTSRSRIAITLHKVVDGNYDTNPISESEFGSEPAPPLPPHNPPSQPMETVMPKLAHSDSVGENRAYASHSGPMRISLKPEDRNQGVDLLTAAKGGAVTCRIIAGPDAQTLALRIHSRSDKRIHIHLEPGTVLSADKVGVSFIASGAMSRGTKRRYNTSGEFTHGHDLEPSVTVTFLAEAFLVDGDLNTSPEGITYQMVGVDEKSSRLFEYMQHPRRPFFPTHRHKIMHLVILARDAPTLDEHVNRVGLPADELAAARDLHRRMCASPGLVSLPPRPWLVDIVSNTPEVSRSLLGRIMDRLAFYGPLAVSEKALRSHTEHNIKSWGESIYHREEAEVVSSALAEAMKNGAKTQVLQHLYSETGTDWRNKYSDFAAFLEWQHVKLVSSGANGDLPVLRTIIESTSQGYSSHQGLARHDVSSFNAYLEIRVANKVLWKEQLKPDWPSSAMMTPSLASEMSKRVAARWSEAVGHPAFW